MNNKILCVDDEPNVLQGYKRTLRKDYDIHIAEGGEQGLAMIANDGPFAVIVSDMRMPGMDGIQFLTRVMDVAPESVRIMLTGNADQQTAMDAVNEGNIFRFLTKPCSPEALARTLDAGLQQYRLITAEKHLLEETLNKSLEVLVDILAIVNPTAFSRATRVKKLARQIADQLNIESPWEIEAAGMLSQVGCVTVPEEILQKVSNGAPLSDKETGLYHQFPHVGHDLIGRIPRMERVAEIISNQNRRINDETVSGADRGSIDVATYGARILKVVLDFDKLIASRNSPRAALVELSERVGWYDPFVLDVLKKITDVEIDEYESVEMPVADLKPGMVLDDPLLSTRGSMLLSAGQEVTMSLILRLMNLADAGIINGTVSVNVPITQAQISA
ncbi:MAG: HD domain-containing phosphohydrolase [Acidobacteriota bacterium]